MGNYLAFYNGNDQIVQNGRSGQGRVVSMLHDDTLRAVQTEEKNILLRSFPSHGTIKVSGSQVHMVQEDGTTYRMNKGNGNRIVLEQKEGDEWKAVARMEAERVTEIGKPSVFIWTKLDDNGEPVVERNPRKITDIKNAAMAGVNDAYRDANQYLDSLYGGNPRNQTREQRDNIRKARAELEQQRTNALSIINEYTGAALFDGLGSNGFDAIRPDYAVIRSLAETGKVPLTPEEEEILRRTYGEENVPPRGGKR
jgi:hypothetical protein